jgi:hypothetical protein
MAIILSQYYKPIRLSPLSLAISQQANYTDRSTDAAGEASAYFCG